LSFVSFNESYRNSASAAFRIPKKWFTRAFSNLQQIMLSIGQIQYPKQCHLLELRTGCRPNISAETAFSELWLAFRIQISIGPAIFKYTDNIEICLKRLLQPFRSHQIEAIR